MNTIENASTLELSMRFPARPEYLCLSRIAVRQAFIQMGMDENRGEAIVLAVVEALTNVIRHSYGGPCDRPVDFMINRYRNPKDGREGLEVIIQDYGPKVDLSRICSRDLDDIRPGGLGVHIIQSTMDEIEYSHGETGGLKLRIVKYK